jgi:uncharacterized protein with FMN-binding domain
MKKLVLSLCFIAVSAGYVWQQKQATPSQIDADLLGDPAARQPTNELLEPPRPSPAVLRIPLATMDTVIAPAGVIKVAAASPSGSAYADGEFAGPAVNAYYGLVQIQATIQGGRLTRLKVLQYPSDRQTSIAINRQALPMLRDEAIAAQKAKVDIISGATLTSQAFIKSLDAALGKAH